MKPNFKRTYPSYKQHEDMPLAQADIDFKDDGTKNIYTYADVLPVLIVHGTLTQAIKAHRERQFEMQQARRELAVQAAMMLLKRPRQPVISGESTMVDKFPVESNVIVFPVRTELDSPSVDAGEVAVYN
jgi:hypothetical protein